ncbi:hypothetical protein [Leifsonia xyli]|uniref:hypothetical protein n=1 Tax=Leifsonia xyli TaxID=1575 RepID=UPI000B17A432|nr:hypothetical protein [Leifsonia xyli]
MSNRLPPRSFITSTGSSCEKRKAGSWIVGEREGTEAEPRRQRSPENQGYCGENCDGSGRAHESAKAPRNELTVPPQRRMLRANLESLSLLPAPPGISALLPFQAAASAAALAWLRDRIGA